MRTTAGLNVTTRLDADGRMASASVHSPTEVLVGVAGKCTAWIEASARSRSAFDDDTSTFRSSAFVGYAPSKLRAIATCLNRAASAIEAGEDYCEIVEMGD